jgi:hypothetical protein
MRTRSIGPSAWTPISSPTSSPFFDAVETSITTSSSPGQLPLSSCSVLNSGLDGSTLKPRFGAPPKTIALPSSSISWVDWLATPPIAEATE